MRAEAELLRQRVAVLLDPASTPKDQRDVVQAWYADWMAQLDLTDPEISGRMDALVEGTWLPNGKAISPINAARCLCEHRRTVQFLRGMDSALAEAWRRFPGETIHVVEAGCGPFALLSLSLAARYPPERVQFTLLDIHEFSLTAAGRLAQKLGVTASIRGRHCVDVTQVRFAEADRPHVIACEVLQQALANEPQVAATMNLAPQLRPGGLFVPERIEVDAGLHVVGDRLRALLDQAVDADKGETAIPTGRTRVMVLDAGTVGERRWSQVRVDLPRHDRTRAGVYLFTRIKVHGEQWLEDYDCSLTLPLKLVLPVGSVTGGALSLTYVTEGTPGFRVTGIPDEDLAPISNP